MVLELISGPAIGMEITSCDSQNESRSKSHCDFRNLCGPSDPVSIYVEIFALFDVYEIRRPYRISVSEYDRKLFAQNSVQT